MTLELLVWEGESHRLGSEEHLCQMQEQRPSENYDQDGDHASSGTCQSDWPKPVAVSAVSKKGSRTDYGRLLADIIRGVAPFLAPVPYRASLFRP